MQRKFVQLTEVLQNADNTFSTQTIHLNIDNIIKIQDNHNIINGFEVYRITLPDNVLVYILDNDLNGGLSDIYGSV